MSAAASISVGASVAEAVSSVAASAGTPGPLGPLRGPLLLLPPLLTPALAHSLLSGLSCESDGRPFRSVASACFSQSGSSSDRGDSKASQDLAAAAAADLAAAADDALACAFAFATGLDLDRLSSPLSMSEISKLLTEAALACVVDWAAGRLLRADLVSTSECSLSPSTNCVIGSSGSRRIFVESDASDSESLSVCGGGPSSPRRVAVA